MPCESLWHMNDDDISSLLDHRSQILGEMKTKEGRLNLDGKGVETLKNGDKIEGVWKNGRPIKASKYVFCGPDDIKWEYEGEVTTKGELLPNGKGVLKIINSKNKLLDFFIYVCIVIRPIIFFKGL